MKNVEPLVETRALTKRYRGITAIQDCTLSIGEGEVFGLLGPNGAGKTTLLRLLMGFLRPTHGGAKIAGRDCYRESAVVHGLVSYLPGDVRLFRGMTGRRVLALLSQLRGKNESTGSLRLAERLGLDVSQRIAQMSTGMRQKLALAAVLGVDAPLWVLDEPTSNLDPTVRTTVMALIAEAKCAGRTVIFSSHVLSEVEQVCDRVVILRRGQIVHDQLMAETRRGHRIRARLTAALPAPPAHLQKQLTVSPGENGNVTIETSDELSSLLGWLATLPLAEVHIEPLGLRTVYEKYHPAGDAT